MKKGASLFFGVGLIVCCLGVAMPGRAAEDQFSGAGEDLLFAEIESVYAASKNEQKTTEAPAKVSIVTAQEIRRYGYRTLDEILNSQPGFYSNYDRNYSYLGVRGFGLPGDYNTRVLILIDGHRTNDAIYDASATDRGFILDVDLIERVEVVRGPSSSLYGSNAFFAIINVITKKGRDLDGLEVSAGGGSYERYQGRLSYGKRLASGLEVLLSGTSYDSDGEESLYYSDFTAYNNGIAENGDDELAESLFARIAFGDFRLDGAWVNREKGIPTAPWDVEFNDPGNRTWDSQAYLDLNYQHFIETANLEVVGRLFYDSYTYTGHYRFDYGLPEIVTNIDHDEARSWGTELQLRRQFGESHHLALGGEYRSSTKLLQQNYDTGGVYLDENHEVDTWGLYVQDEWAITDKIILNLGVRHDEYDISGGTTNPRGALIFAPLVGSSLKVLYGEAFRAPSAYELFYHDGEETSKAALELEPETIQSLELVWEQQISTGLFASASVFHNKIDELIGYTDDPGPDLLLGTADDLLVFANLGEAEANGFELAVEGKLEGGWLASLSYTYQDAEDKETGEWLVNSPHHLVKANLAAPLVGESLTGGLEMRYESERKTVADARTDGFFYASVTLISTDLVEGLTLALTIYNLFDNGYYYPASEEHAMDIIEQDGRTYWLKINYLL